MTFACVIILRAIWSFLNIYILFNFVQFIFVSFISIYICKNMTLTPKNSLNYCEIKIKKYYKNKYLQDVILSNEDY